ncbi:hypothetical protein BV898_12537 [Hypsibius exemplaris]|uniref:Glycosyltransferase 2-like domain-containing protein n=1 Tax=Hypsibius exemplaris TaxID=2072580 RepID=A0A1W0WDK5_HYPEX|nr:hypothetical protein BV898_12537 [Hypsibius exemplaris]
MMAPIVKQSALVELVKPSLFVISTAYPSTKFPDFDWKQELYEKPLANSWFRWNLLWFAFFCIFFIPIPLWLYPVTCIGAYLASVIVTIWMCVVLFACMVSATSTMVKMYRVRNTSWISDDPAQQKLVHVLVMAGYKEPLAVMLVTLDSLKAQTVASRLFVVVGLEEKTPDFEAKSAAFQERYKGVFLHLMVTQHPSGIEGEIPGKSSNVNYAARQAVEQLKDMSLYNLDRCIITTCDTDNPFPPKYFEYLSYDFLRRAERFEVVWQAPLLYNYDLDKRPFFVRITGILRAVFMMGILIKQNITSMSIFSMSLRLMENGFVHPAYQMEDIINIVRRMVAIHKLVKICLIPYPVISGPTSGETYKQEIIEWARQARRWTIGAAEVFHYLCIKFRHFSSWSGIFYALIFTHYYGFVVCGMSLFNFANLIGTSIYHGVEICIPEEYLGREYFIYLPLIGLGFSYLFFLWAIIMDAFGCRLSGVKEDVSFLRNVAHWLLSPAVLLAYSFIEYYAIFEVAIYGKKVCSHSASKKTGLVQKF